MDGEKSIDMLEPCMRNTSKMRKTFKSVQQKIANRQQDHVLSEKTVLSREQNVTLQNQAMANNLPKYINFDCSEETYTLSDMNQFPCISDSVLYKRNKNGFNSFGGITQEVQAKRNISMEMHTVPEKCEKKGNNVKGKDPIIIKITAALQDCKRKQLQQKKPEEKFALANDDPDLIIRKRGKVREVPKKKPPTCMKAALIAEREHKICMKEVMKQELFKTGMIDRESLLPHEKINCQFREITVTKNVTNEEMKRSDSNDNMSNDISLKELSKTLIHTRKFRDYCNNVVTCNLSSAVEELVSQLVRFQDRHFAKEPIKACARRRYVLGLRETFKHLKMKKLKLIIIAPDIEDTQHKDGPDKFVGVMAETARQQGMPYVYASNRWNLGRAAFRKTTTCCIGIISFSGAEDLFERVMTLLEPARKLYLEKLSALEQFCSPLDAQSGDAVASLLAKLTCHDSAFLAAIERASSLAEDVQCSHTKCSE